MRVSDYKLIFSLIRNEEVSRKETIKILRSEDWIDMSLVCKSTEVINVLKKIDDEVFERLRCTPDKNL